MMEKMELNTGRSHILRNCPVCGRPLRIAPQYIGRELICDHCRGRFVALPFEAPALVVADLDLPGKDEWLPLT